MIFATLVCAMSPSHLSTVPVCQHVAASEAGLVAVAVCCSSDSHRAAC